MGLSDESWPLRRSTLSRFGITRVGDITHLDQTGVFVSIATRPRSNTIIVFSGRGTSKIQAQVSGVMEAIEGYCAESQNFQHSIVKASYRSLQSASLRTVYPPDLVLGIDATYNDDLELFWVEGFDIAADRAIMVPRDAVFIPLPPDETLIEPTTNGLGAGFTRNEAILHGLYEVVERDACSFAEVFKDPVAIRPNGVPFTKVRELVDSCIKAGCYVRLYYLETDIRIPTFIAVVEDRARNDPLFFNIGHGADLDPQQAMIRALTEAAQSRLLYIGGAREDLWQLADAVDYQEAVQNAGYAFLTNERNACEFQEIVPGEMQSPRSSEEALIECLLRLTNAGFNSIIAVDLTPDDTSANLSVMRVIVPGLESYYSDQTRIGPRIRKKLVTNPVIGHG